MWNKTKRAFDVMHERNARYLGKKDDEQAPPDEMEPETDKSDIMPSDLKDDSDLKLEKGDLLALIISAFLTFSPIFIVLGLILYLAWTFLH